MDDYSKKQYIKANVKSLSRPQRVGLGRIVYVAGEKMFVQVASQGSSIDMDSLSTSTIDRMYWHTKHCLSA